MALDSAGAGVLLAVLGLLGAAAVVLWKARNAGLAMHRQLDALREQVDTERNDHNVWSARLQEELAGQRQKNQEASAQITQTLQSVDSRLNMVTARVNEMSGSVDMLVRKPIHTLMIDTLMIDQTNSEEALALLAESLAILRPLVPYPRWYTDADLFNPDLSYQLRRWFWQYFHDRRRDVPITVRWHAGTRLRLYLGNDVSGQIYIAGCWEPNELAFLDRILRPGMTVLDAGANDGVYTVFAAKRVGTKGTVWAFEPSPRELERLRYNLDLNGLQARIFPVALAETNGQAELAIGGYEHEGHNTLGAFAYAGVEMARKETVELRRLDDLVAENPPARIDVMKLDVEGAELRLLRGAISTLERYRPVVLFEVSEASLQKQAGSSEELIAFLRAQKYELYTFDHGTGLVVPAAPDDLSNNMVGIPEEKYFPETVRQPWPTLLPSE